MKEKITVLVADDNNEFTTTLASYLQKDEEMEVIAIAKDGNEAYEMIVNTIAPSYSIDLNVSS